MAISTVPPTSAAAQVAPIAAPAQSADQLAQQGLAAHHAGDLALAQTRYRECLALNPAHADAMLMLGVLRIAALDFVEAEQLIETAGKLTHWRNPAYRQNYGLVLSAIIPHHDPVSGVASRVPLRQLTEHIAARENQPLSTLKTALRNGAGAALDGAQLTRIATRIRTSPRRTSSASLLNDGFDLIGYAHSESGLAENMRALARSCVASDIPHTLIDIELDGDGEANNPTLTPPNALEPAFKRQIICVNPDAMAVVAHHEGTGAFTSAYKIGYWFWELEKLPATWMHMAGSMQELWAGSEFVRKALASAVSIPVYKVPTSILPPQPSRPYARSEFGIADDDFVFLFSFSYWSFIARKNPWAVINAFRQALPPSITRAKLIIKTIHSEKFAQQSAALHALAAGDPRIVFIDHSLSRDQVMGLQHACDCYVSLHRSEGFGLGMAECMALGKPVIATAYSANLDYMNEANSLLVDYSLIAVKADEYPDAQQQVWADANVESAARNMRALFDDQALRARLGSAAKDFMQTHFSPAAVGAHLQAHLLRLNR